MKESQSSLLNRSDVQSLLKAFIDGSITVLKPVLSQTGDFTYPEAEKIMRSSSHFVKEILEALSEESVLLKELFTLVVVCPYCGDNRLTIELACPHCGSTKLEVGTTIEHLECGYIGFEEDIKNMVCPKCGKQMRALGIDYRKPGVMYKCTSCNEFVEPKKKYTCLKGHVFYEDNAVLKKVFSYRLNPHKKDIVEKDIIDLNIVAKVLSAKGLLVKTPARIRGKSGVEHMFTLLASSKNGVSAVVVDVLVSDKYVDDYAISVLIKALDIDASEKIVVFIPGLTEKARSILNYYRVNINIIECNDISKVNIAILNVLNNLLKPLNNIT